jgi:hypothetical protein
MIRFRSGSDATLGTEVAFAVVRSEHRQSARRGIMDTGVGIDVLRIRMLGAQVLLGLESDH